jgi:hypothetical protein
VRQVWAYQASDGVTYHGIMTGFTDRGGTDVTYRFHRLGPDGLPIVFDNGGIRLDLISGYALKQAKRIGATPDGQPFLGV